MDLSHVLDMDSSGIAANEYMWNRVHRANRNTSPPLIIHTGNHDFAKDEHKRFKKGPWKTLMMNTPSDGGGTMWDEVQKYTNTLNDMGYTLEEFLDMCEGLEFCLQGREHLRGLEDPDSDYTQYSPGANKYKGYATRLNRCSFGRLRTQRTLTHDLFLGPSVTELSIQLLSGLAMTTIISASTLA